MIIKSLGIVFMLSNPFLGITQVQNLEFNKEPKSKFTLSINGKKYEISEDDELVLDTIIKPKISIKLSEIKKFENSSISFDYPRNMFYEFSQDFGYKNWALTGSSALVLFFELESETTVTELVDEIIKKFEKKNCKIENFQKKVGAKNLVGQKINITLVGQKLIVECLEIKSSDSKSRFIYFQDSLEDEKNSKEFEKVNSIISSSIIYK